MKLLTSNNNNQNKKFPTSIVVLSLASYWISARAPTVVSSFLVPNNNNYIHRKVPVNMPLNILGGSVSMIKIASSTSQNANLAQYADAATSLFSNMITPASCAAPSSHFVLDPASTIMDRPANQNLKNVRLEALMEQRGLSIGENDFLRKIFPFVSTASMASLLVAITCSSVAVNQLTENKPAFAASVWDLLQRDYALAWAAVNSHFVFGMLGFMWLVGSKAYFMGGGPAAFGLALSGLTAMVSIVNRGVAIGGGKDSQRFGASVIGLVQSYLGLLWNHARHSRGPLEYVAVALFVGSVIGYSQHVLKQVFG